MYISGLEALRPKRETNYGVRSGSRSLGVSDLGTPYSPKLFLQLTAE